MSFGWNRNRTGPLGYIEKCREVERRIVAHQDSIVLVNKVSQAGIAFGRCLQIHPTRRELNANMLHSVLAVSQQKQVVVDPYPLCFTRRGALRIASTSTADIISL